MLSEGPNVTYTPLTKSMSSLPKANPPPISPSLTSAVPPSLLSSLQRASSSNSGIYHPSRYFNASHWILHYHAQLDLQRWKSQIRNHRLGSHFLSESRRLQGDPKPSSIPLETKSLNSEFPNANASSLVSLSTTRAHEHPHFLAFGL